MDGCYKSLPRIANPQVCVLKHTGTFPCNLRSPFIVHCVGSWCQVLVARFCIEELGLEGAESAGSLLLFGAVVRLLCVCMPDGCVGVRGVFLLLKPGEESKCHYFSSVHPG